MTKTLISNQHPADSSHHESGPSLDAIRRILTGLRRAHGDVTYANRRMLELQRPWK
jgi:hypothetical protein